MSVDHDQLPITSPCPITLDRSGVQDRDRSMFCDHCTKDVHMLSKMTEREARAFLRAHDGQDICVSYAIRKDGEIRFRSDPPLVPVAALARRPKPRRLAMVASIGAAALLAGCAPHSEPESATAKTSDKVVTQQIEEPCEPDPHEDIQVDGGIRAMPIDEPPPVENVEPIAEIGVKPEMHMAGGIRARPLRPEPIIDHRPKTGSRPK